jgi:hypothetical protein
MLDWLQHMVLVSLGNGIHDVVGFDLSGSLSLSGPWTVAMTVRNLPVSTAGPYRTDFPTNLAALRLPFWRWAISATGGFEPQPLEVGFAAMW